MATAIEELTKDQEELLEQYYDRWMKAGYSTERLKKKKLQAALTRAYKTLELPAPKLHIAQGPIEGVHLAIKLGDKRTAQDIRRDYLYGTWELYWLWHYKFGLELDPKLYETADVEEIEAWTEVAQESHLLLCYEKAVIAIERPIALHVDEEGRLHCENGPAIQYAEETDLGMYEWHEVRVPKQVIMSPEKLTISQIENEANQEIRRVMLERFGFEKFLTKSKTKCVHKDKWGSLYRKEIKGDEDLVMVSVKNSTPEPDGSIKQYFLRVPPSIATAHDAVAWTFSKNAATYNPLVET
jgi:hypothetical protein